MSMHARIRQSMQGVITYFTEHPDRALSQDEEAVAIIEAGLRARARGPDGQTLLCDMPTALGGGAPSPGWMMRAALANCEGIMMAFVQPSLMSNCPRWKCAWAAHRTTAACWA